MSEPTPAPATEESPQTRSPRRVWLALVPMIGGILLLLAAIALVFAILLMNLSRSETSPGMPLTVVKLTPTVPVPATPVPPSSCKTIISSGDVQAAVPLPTSLTVGDAEFPVVAIVSGAGGWGYPAGSSGTAMWACGTVVNYVLGLEPTPENEALLSGLRPGDPLTLRLSNGVTLSFRFGERREAAAQEAGVFEQMRPRLTLILETASGAWQVASADYVAETESVQPPPAGVVAQPGQPVRVGDAQVTVSQGHAERNVANLQPGTMVYLVEFSVENLGAAALDTSAFNMQLQDSLGNSYLLSPAASAFGQNGPLSGQVAPGMTVQGSAGYIVPDTLAGPTLVWTFSPQPGSEVWASVSIPYEVSPPVVVSPASAQVTITDAFLSADGSMLMIEGQIVNSGGSPLTVELGDISLSSSAGMGSLRMAAPPLPWTIQPAQTQVIELQYDTPDAPSVLLSLLGYSFEISGL